MHCDACRRHPLTWINAAPDQRIVGRVARCHDVARVVSRHCPTGSAGAQRYRQRIGQ
jgi:hypothetical protein